MRHHEVEPAIFRNAKVGTNTDYRFVPRPCVAQLDARTGVRIRAIQKREHRIAGVDHREAIFKHQLEAVWFPKQWFRSLLRQNDIQPCHRGPQGLGQMFVEALFGKREKRTSEVELHGWPYPSQRGDSELAFLSALAASSLRPRTRSDSAMRRQADACACGSPVASASALWPVASACAGLFSLKRI